LHNLKTGDPLLPPDLDTTRTLEVVPVHDNVNEKVQRNDSPGYGCQANKLGIAEKSSGTMVVAVKEGQWLLLQDEEHSVNQFEVFREVIEVVEDNQFVGPSTFASAYGVKKAMVVEGRHQLFNKQRQQNCADTREVKVVDHERKVQLESWAVPHNFPSSKYYHVVCNNRQSALLHCRHGGYSWLEVEVLRVIALHGREGFVEDRP